MKIVEFLEARIAEDEATAEYLLGREDDAENSYGEQFRAEAAAKRILLEQRKRIDRSASMDSWSAGWSDANYAALGAIATVYKDYPDYRTDWTDAT